MEKESNDAGKKSLNKKDPKVIKSTIDKMKEERSKKLKKYEKKKSEPKERGLQKIDDEPLEMSLSDLMPMERKKRVRIPKFEVEDELLKLREDEREKKKEEEKEKEREEENELEMTLEQEEILMPQFEAQSSFSYESPSDQISYGGSSGGSSMSGSYSTGGSDQSNPYQGGSSGGGAYQGGSSGGGGGYDGAASYMPEQSTMANAPELNKKGQSDLEKQIMKKGDFKRNY